jgi:hypothetical protein
MHRARAADERCQHWSCDKRAAASTPPGRGDRDFARRVADAAPSAERDPPRASASTREGRTDPDAARKQVLPSSVSQLTSSNRRFGSFHYLHFVSSESSRPAAVRLAQSFSSVRLRTSQGLRRTNTARQPLSRTPERARASASCPLDRLQHTRRHGAWQDYQHRLLAVKTARQCARACKSAMKPGSRERASAGPARADGESL